MRPAASRVTPSSRSSSAWEMPNAFSFGVASVPSAGDGAVPGRASLLLRPELREDVGDVARHDVEMRADIGEGDDAPGRHGGDDAQHVALDAGEEGGAAHSPSFL
jgi:hypothetical protein